MSSTETLSGLQCHITLKATRSCILSLYSNPCCSFQGESKPLEQMATFASQIIFLVTLAFLASSAVLPGALEPINVINHVANFSAIPISISSWPSEHTTPNISYSELGHILGQVGTPPYKCDPLSYGRDLQIRSCREALLAIPSNTRKLKLGVRDPGEQRNDVNLPYRFSSGMSSFA